MIREKHNCHIITLPHCPLIPHLNFVYFFPRFFLLLYILLIERFPAAGCPPVVMLITTWNEADKIRHSIDVQQLCNGKQVPLIKEWNLSGGVLSVRKSCLGRLCFVLFQWSFPASHFVEVAARENDSPIFIYVDTGEKEAADNRLEVLASTSIFPKIYCRAQHGSVLAIEGSAIILPTITAPVLPCCGDSRRQLNELITNPWIDHIWLQQKWEWLSASLLHEAREGCRQFPLAAGHRDKIKQVAEGIYLHPAGNETIAQLSKTAGISGTYLKKFFRQYYGQSILQFRQYYRMQASCRLLSNTTIALQDIAIACGFQDDSNFVRAFQRYFGISPVKGMR